MPYKPKRPCRQPGCPNLTDNQVGYCHAHIRAADNYRDSANQRGYDCTWRKVRHSILKDNPLCVVCLQSKRVQAAVLVHHKDRNARNNDHNNLVALCIDCHAKEHGKDKAIKK